jgi:hypothetical protein
MFSSAEMVFKPFLLLRVPQVPQGCRKGDMLANTHYILCPKFSHRHAPLYIVFLILSLEPSVPSIILACLIRKYLTLPEAWADVYSLSLACPDHSAGFTTLRISML